MRDFIDDSLINFEFTEEEEIILESFCGKYRDKMKALGKVYKLPTLYGDSTDEEHFELLRLLPENETVPLMMEKITAEGYTKERAQELAKTYLKENKKYFSEYSQIINDKVKKDQQNASIKKSFEDLTTSE